MSSDPALTLLACQIDVPQTRTAAARDAHTAATIAKVRAQLASQPADVVVLPELSSIEYSRAAFDQLEEISEPLDGPSFAAWAPVAEEFGAYICFGFARRAPSGTYISMAVVAPDGTYAGHYDKLHLCQYGASMEKEYFEAGNGIFRFRVKGFTLAPIICYDIRIPELTRRLVLGEGVDVLLHCGAYFRDPSFATWHPFATTRALENQIFLLSLNRAGQDYGQSMFCYPWMDDTRGPKLFADHAEDFKYIKLKQEWLHAARKEYTFLRDRRETYDLQSTAHP